jgi:hypothetical protein
MIIVSMARLILTCVIALVCAMLVIFVAVLFSVTSSAVATAMIWLASLLSRASVTLELG